MALLRLPVEMSNKHHWNPYVQRWATALLMAAPVLLVLTVGPYWSWTLVVGILVGTGLWEFQAMIFGKGLPVWWQAFYVFIGLLFPLGASAFGPMGLHGALFISLFAALVAILIFSPTNASAVSRMAHFVLGWLYIPYMMSFVLFLRHLSFGSRWVFFALLVTIANDASALYSGKYFGRHKLYERVSPKKTIEGSAGGLVGGLLVGTLFGYLFLSTVPIGRLMLLSLVLVIIGQIGDLIESLIKRLCGVKDSSNILPGHGGILDRLDSLLFVFPAVWFFLNWIDYQ